MERKGKINQDVLFLWAAPGKKGRELPRPPGVQEVAKIFSSRFCLSGRLIHGASYWVTKLLSQV
jgi:hypothetical protein